jgi:hypothetical protein
MTGQTSLCDWRELFLRLLRRGLALSSAEKRRAEKRCHARLYLNQRNSCRLLKTLFGVKFLSTKKRRVAQSQTLKTKKRH